MMLACFFVVLPMPTHILPLVGDSIMPQFYVNFLIKLQNEHEGSCVVEDYCYSLSTTFGADHDLLDNEVICFVVFCFQTSLACSYTTFTDFNWG
jgi:hypothetical protein